MLWYLDNYTRSDRSYWRELVEETLGLWEMDITRPLSDVCWEEANDENTDWIYTANENQVVAAAVASKDRALKQKDAGYGWDDEIEDETTLAILFEVTRRALHTFLFHDAYVEAEGKGYDMSEQVITDDGWAPYLKKAGLCLA